MKTGIFLLASVLALTSACGRDGHEGHEAAEASKKQVYHCPMHPTYTSEKPGECPICGMDLVPVEAREHAGRAKEAGVEGQAAVQVDARRRQLIGLTTEPAARRKMIKVIRTVGRIAYDPELYRTQEEFLTALESVRRIERGGSSEASERARNLLKSSRLKLKILGLSETQIDELARLGRPETSLLLSQGKGGKPWLYADVYESELPLVRVGQRVEATSPSAPGQAFEGTVKAIDPAVNPKTRSVRVRAQLEDPKGLLRPDTYLNARIRVDLGELLAIPESAVIDTGVRQVVFIDEGDGYLAPREVTMGVRTEGYAQVREGLAEGDPVVTSGNFLIDSESKLQAAISAFAGGHAH